MHMSECNKDQPQISLIGTYKGDYSQVFYSDYSSHIKFSVTRTTLHRFSLSFTVGLKLTSTGGPPRACCMPRKYRRRQIHMLLQMAILVEHSSLGTLQMETYHLNHLML